jgi:regulatory protein
LKRSPKSGGSASDVPPDLARVRQKAIALLTRREHTRAELRRKLALPDREALEALLDDLSARGWLSDARFAEQYVREHAARFGRDRLVAELRERGVGAADIEVALAQLEVDEAPDELSRARALWRRKFGVPADDPAGRARQARFLQSRGFAFEVIRRVIRGLDED